MTDKKKKAASKNPPEVKFHDEHFLALKLGVDRRFFHRKIKPIIIADFPEIIREIGSSNPDVGLDANNNLYLGNADRSIVIPTGYTIFDYI